MFIRIILIRTFTSWWFQFFMDIVINFI